MLARLPAVRGVPFRVALGGLMLTLVSGVSLAEETKGMPQLDPQSYASQLFWLAVFFILIFAFLGLVGVPRVTSILKERSGKLDGDIETADRLRSEAAEAEKAYTAAMAAAHGQARQMLAETHEQNVAKLAEQTHAAAAEFDRKVGEAVKRIEAARAAALAGVREVATGLAADITLKLANRAPAAESVARAVERAAGQEAA